MSDEGKSIEERAAAMGHVSKENFKGDPAKWVDAETFVKRGEEIMPILKHNNERLTSELNTVKGELTKITSLFQASQEAIEELKSFNSEAARRVAQQARKDLLDEMKVARESGDLEAEESIRAELTKVDESIKTAEATKKAESTEEKKAPTGPKPEDIQTVQEWVAENQLDWFGKDKRKTALMFGIAEELRADPETGKLTGRPFYDAVYKEYQKMMTPASSGSRVEGSRGGASLETSGSKTYADLPADAKAACDRQGRKLVGEGRAYKTDDEWRQKYTELYFAQ